MCMGENGANCFESPKTCGKGKKFLQQACARSALNDLSASVREIENGKMGEEHTLCELFL